MEPVHESGTVERWTLILKRSRALFDVVRDPDSRESLERGGWELVDVVPAAERDRYRKALEALMEFGKRLMNSDVMEERGIGCCICEGARVIEGEGSLDG